MKIINKIISKILCYFDIINDYNIEYYLNTLPNYIEIIDLSNRNLNNIPYYGLYKFYNLKIFKCNNNKLIDLPCFKNNYYLEEIYCDHNNINNIYNIEINLKKLDCSYNILEYLEINNNLEYLDCSHNKIQEIILNNRNLLYINCSYNKLELLPNIYINYNLEELYCDHNNIIFINSLIDNKKLKKIDCSYNKLEKLPYLNYELCFLDCSNNLLNIKNVSDIINNYKYLIKLKHLSC